MTQEKVHKEPLLRIAKRDSIPRPKAWAIHYTTPMSLCVKTL